MFDVMQSRSQKFHRLLGALDELVTREAMTVKTGDYDAVQDIQSRVEPVLVEMATMNPEMEDSLARARVASLLARRQHNIDLIETQLATARQELAAVQQSTSRVAKIAPVYGRPDGFAIMPRFSAAG